MSIEPQIAIDKVAHVYRPPRGRPVLALDDISLQVQPREFLALLGPSGCGKSTLLYLIGGFLPIEKGTISCQRRAGEGARPRPRLSCSAFRAVSVEDRARQHPLRVGAPGSCRAQSDRCVRSTSLIWWA
jgi:ABC-type dipeptide/oligopeptide/nickel transport system ATPase subunit